MLKEILSIAGRPGLYKLISYGKNMVIVEGLHDQKRFPAHARDRIVSLGDISIYTQTDEVPLANVFKSTFEKYDGKAVDKEVIKSPQGLRDFMTKVLPDYDQERVHNSDIKKLVTWYNLLVDAGMTDFEIKEEEPSEE